MSLSKTKSYIGYCDKLIDEDKSSPRSLNALFINNEFLQRIKSREIISPRNLKTQVKSTFKPNFKPGSLLRETI